MSANAESQTPQQPVNNKKGKRTRILLILTLLFIVIAVAYGIYWFLVLRHHEETDDAYVAGNQVQIMAQVSGSVTKVWVDNTDFVKKGDVLVTLDPTDAQQAFEKAQTELASSVRQTRQMMINSKQYQANIEVKKTAGRSACGAAGRCRSTQRLARPAAYQDRQPHDRLCITPCGSAWGADRRHHPADGRGASLRPVGGC